MECTRDTGEFPPTESARLVWYRVRSISADMFTRLYFMHVDWRGGRLEKTAVSGMEEGFAPRVTRV